MAARGLLVAILLLPLALPASADQVYKRGSGSGSGVSNGDKGDVVVSGAGTGSEAWTLDAGVVLPGHALTRDPISGSDACIGKTEPWVNTTTGEFFDCTDEAADIWLGQPTPYCYPAAAQSAASDGIVFGAYAPFAGAKVIRIGCLDITNAAAGITTPFTVQAIRSDNGNAVGAAATCGGKDQAITWVDVSADADGTLTAGQTLSTNVTAAAPNPAATAIMYCLIARPQ